MYYILARNRAPLQYWQQKIGSYWQYDIAQSTLCEYYGLTRLLKNPIYGITFISDDHNMLERLWRVHHARMDGYFSNPSKIFAVE